MYVFVIDSDKKPLDAIHPARARQLLKSGKAAIFKRYPFIIILKEEVIQEEREYHLKIDPGASTTGLALLHGNKVIWLANLKHRGFQIRESLTSRRQLRSARRGRKTRYRKPRFLNRARPNGWLAPSLLSRVHNTITFVRRLKKVCNIIKITFELVKFDTQKLANPEITGVEYQQGELLGYELREYMLEKWQRKCAYCQVTNIPLQIDHIIPRSKRGSNRVSNLTLACEKCNTKKGNKSIEEFLKKKPELLKSILVHTKRPLADAAAVNATRWKLFEKLKRFSLELKTGTGGQTKYNRIKNNLPKQHYYDAACVGNVGSLEILSKTILEISAKGHGTRQQCRTDKHGFPIRYCDKKKIHYSFQTGDIVKAIVIKGKKVGTYTGRIAVRKTGNFNIQTANELIQGISYKYCKAIHKKDGYGYQAIKIANSVSSQL